MATTQNAGTVTTRGRKTPAKNSELAPGDRIVEEIVSEGKARLPYSATGRGGKTVVRHYSTPMHFAVDVADANAKSEAGRKGLIWSLHPTQEKAEKAAERYGSKEGLSAIVVPATEAQIDAE
ncbi:hypothetical protein [Mycobacteroides abscessus]|uniref:hypothetical protein n=1 Tax=Mycobacteroides abscessus TaxID=36809 RepID=UPI0019294BED|nr:hypothetical protein [Mycobacteroides abscessus]MBL3753009.1 hypothetical protein [Mycobacteroides abscessus subsp. massiliense]